MLFSADELNEASELTQCPEDAWSPVDAEPEFDILEPTLDFSVHLDKAVIAGTPLLTREPFEPGGLNHASFSFAIRLGSPLVVSMRQARFETLGAPPLACGRVRREGGGRDASLLDGLKCLVEPATSGDPMRPLLWVSKSLDKLALALATMGTRSAPTACVAR